MIVNTLSSNVTGLVGSATYEWTMSGFNAASFTNPTTGTLTSSGGTVSVIFNYDENTDEDGIVTLSVTDEGVSGCTVTEDFNFVYEVPVQWTVVTPFHCAGTGGCDGIIDAGQVNLAGLNSTDIPLNYTVSIYVDNILQSPSSYSVDYVGSVYEIKNIDMGEATLCAGVKVIQIIVTDIALERNYTKAVFTNACP